MRNSSRFNVIRGVLLSLARALGVFPARAGMNRK